MRIRDEERRTSAARRHGLPLLVATLLASGCGGRMPMDLGLSEGRLRPCPSSPNCVSSQATDETHAIEPIRLSGNARRGWEALVVELQARERVRIVDSKENYLHAVFTTRLMRYRDDVEFLFDEPGRRIEVRSASRVGYGDMGTNRRRVESLRTALVEKEFALPSDAD